MKMEELKYEYHLYTWGGFYNEEYLKIHGHQNGDFWFETFEERQEYIETLKQIEKDLNARHLVMTLSEGYCCRIETILHRVIEFENNRYYSQYNMGINYPMSAAKFHMEYKWYPGFNDYPLGDDFDYSKVKTIQEWVTGADQTAWEYK